MKSRTTIAAVTVSAFCLALAWPSHAASLAPNDSSISNNLVLWLKDAPATFVAGTWQDSSDSGIDAAAVGTPGSVTYGSPVADTLTPSGGLFDGETILGVLFDGAADDLLVASNINSDAGMSDVTIIAVCSISGTDAADSQVRCVGFGSKNAEDSSSLSDNLHLACDGSLRYDDGFDAGSAIPTAAFIRATRLQSSSQVTDFYRTESGFTTNIGPKASGSSGGLATTRVDEFYLGDLNAGATANITAAKNADIFISQVAVYDDALSDQQVADIANWMAENPEGVAAGETAHNVPITFDYGLSSPLTNFPVLVKLSEGIDDFDYHTFYDYQTGLDLRFKDASFSSNLNYEIELWDPAGTSYVWVCVPVLTNGTTIYASWGDTSETNRHPSTTNGSVWVNGYVGVWHMADQSPADASGTGNDGVGTGGATATGIAGGARAFDGDDYISVTDDDSLDFGTSEDFSITAWINYAGGQNDQLTVVGKGDMGGNPRYFMKVKDDQAGDTLFLTVADSGNNENGEGSADLLDGLWHHLAMSVDRSAGLTGYADGSADGTAGGVTTGIDVDGTTDLQIGRSWDGTADRRYFYGDIDEVRIANVARSAVWIEAEYLTMASNDVVTTYGEAQTALRYKLALSFTNYPSVGTTLTNFPVLVKFSDTITDFDYSTFLDSADGDDLRFKTADLSSNLNYDVELWDNGATSVVWVCIPELTNGTTIYATWGARTEASFYPSRTNGSVWVNGYVGVWHMADLSVVDSSTNGYDASDVGNVTIVGGIIGKGTEHTTSASEISVGDVDEIGGATALTVSMWANPDVVGGGGSDDRTLFTKAGTWHGQNGTLLWWFDDSQGDAMSLVVPKDGGSGGDNSAFLKGDPGTDGDDLVDTWTHLAFTYEASAVSPGILNTYVNAGQETTVYLNTDYDVPIPSIHDTTDPVRIGGSPDTKYFDGTIDEVRIATAKRSTAWLEAEYLTAASNDWVTTYGAVDVPAGAGNPPEIANLAATGITATAAWLNGDLTTTGGYATAVWVYWGASDGGTDAGAWSYTNFFGTNTVGATTYSTNTADMGETLTEGVTYYYNYYAENADGGVWADTSLPSESFTPDATPPTWSINPSITDTNGQGFTLEATINEDGTAYYVVLTNMATAPSAAEVKAGTGSGGSAAVTNGSFALTGGVAGSDDVEGLSGLTSYDVYVVAEDDHPTPNLQASPYGAIDVKTLHSLLAEDYFDTAADSGRLDSTSSLSDNTGWAGSSYVSGSGSVSVYANGLSFSNARYSDAASGNGVRADNSSRSGGRKLGAFVSGTLWMSYLVELYNPNQANAAVGLREGKDAGNENWPGYGTAVDGVDYVWNVGGSVYEAGAAQLNEDQTYLAIVRFSLAGGGSSLTAWHFAEGDTIPVSETALDALTGNKLTKSGLSYLTTGSANYVVYHGRPLLADSMRISDQTGDDGLLDVLKYELPPAVVVDETGGSTEISEDGSTDTFSVYLQAEPANAVTVTCTFATNQLDLSSTQLVFTVWNYANAQTVTVSAVDDALVEGTHEVTITNTSTSTDGNYDGIAVSNVVVSVTDNEGSGEFHLASATYSVGEADGVVTVGVVRVGSGSGAANIDFGTSDGTAEAGTDYTATNGTLSWADGVLGTNWFAVHILDNDITDDPDATFSAAISNATAGSIVSPSNATVTIVDNDPRGELSFTSATYTVSEDVGTLTVNVLRQNGSNEAVSVQFGTVDGTAAAGDDYTATSGTLNWADDEGGIKSFSVTILNDSEFTADRAFTVALSNAAAAALVSPSNTTVTITDDEPFALIDHVLIGADPSAGEYNLGGLSGESPTIAGASGGWSAASGSSQVRSPGLSNAVLVVDGGSIGHNRSGGGYTGIWRSLSGALGSGGDSFTLWFASLHNVSGFASTSNRSHWQYDLGSGTLRWGIYQQNLHAFGTDIAAAAAGQTYLFVAKLEKNYSGSTDRWSVWVDPPEAGSEVGLGTPDATGTSDFWKDANGVSQIAAEIQGNSDNGEIGYIDEIRIAERFSDLGLILIPRPAGCVLVIR